MTTSIIKRRRSTKVSTCRHEAGHCVVAIALNFRRIISCEVWRRRDKWEGRVTFECVGDNPLDQQTEFQGLKVVIAGVLGEFPNLDADNVESHLPTSDLIPFRCALEIASKDRNVSEVLLDAVNQTMQLLIENSDVLDRIADVLFKKNRITGNEVLEIFGDSAFEPGVVVHE